LNPFVGRNLEEIIALLNQINDEQASVTHDGKFIATPHFVITTKDGDKIKVGKHTLKQQNGVVVGITYTHGNMGRPTTLYPTDISKIEKTFTFERTDI